MSQITQTMTRSLPTSKFTTTTTTESKGREEEEVEKEQQKSSNSTNKWHIFGKNLSLISLSSSSLNLIMSAGNTMTFFWMQFGPDHSENILLSSTTPLLPFLYL